MECRYLEVTVISASGLMDVRHNFEMNPYVVASLFRDGHHTNKQRTPAHRGGGTSPRWDHALAVPFTVDVAAARAGLLTLKLKIKTERTLKGDKDVGWVDVPVRYLLEQGGDGKTRAMSYAVRLPQSESTRGVLEFWYRFGESFSVSEGAPHQPPKSGWRRLGEMIFGPLISGGAEGVVESAMSNASGDD